MVLPFLLQVPAWTLTQNTYKEEHSRVPSLPQHKCLGVCSPLELQEVSARTRAHTNAHTHTHLGPCHGGEYLPCRVTTPLKAPEHRAVLERFLENCSLLQLEEVPASTHARTAHPPRALPRRRAPTLQSTKHSHSTRAHSLKACSPLQAQEVSAKQQ